MNKLEELKNRVEEWYREEFYSGFDNLNELIESAIPVDSEELWEILTENRYELYDVYKDNTEEILSIYDNISVAIYYWLNNNIDGLAIREKVEKEIQEIIDKIRDYLENNPEAKEKFENGEYEPLRRIVENFDIPITFDEFMKHHGWNI